MFIGMLEYGFPSGYEGGVKPKESLSNLGTAVRFSGSIARDVLKHGRGAKLYKVDLSRAYRQLRTCPLDWHLLMVRWDGKLYVGVAVPFESGPGNWTYVHRCTS